MLPFDLRISQQLFGVDGKPDPSFLALQLQQESVSYRLRGRSTLRWVPFLIYKGCFEQENCTIRVQSFRYDLGASTESRIGHSAKRFFWNEGSKGVRFDLYNATENR